MPQGLIIKNASNQIILDLTDRCGRFKGSFSVTNTSSSGSFTVPIQTNEKIFFLLNNTRYPDGITSGYQRIPRIQYSGNVISWEWPLYEAATDSQGIKMWFDVYYGVL